MKAIKMRMAGVPVKQVLDELHIKNHSQLKTWMKWYRNGEIHRLHQPVGIGKQYTYGKGPNYASEEARLQAENRYLKQQIEVLKKYQEIERKWLAKHKFHYSYRKIAAQFPGFSEKTVQKVMQKNS